MAADTTNIQVNDVSVSRTTGAEHGPLNRRIGMIGVVAFLIAITVGGVAFYSQRTSYSAAPANADARFSTAQQYEELMAQEEVLLHTIAARATMRQAAAYYDDLMTQEEDFIHTMAARADARLAPLSEQQQFIESNTITLPSEGELTYMEALTPPPGHPY